MFTPPPRPPDPYIGHVYVQLIKIPNDSMGGGVEAYTHSAITRRTSGAP